jgi:hypothetical protein
LPKRIQKHHPKFPYQVFHHMPLLSGPASGRPSSGFNAQTSFNRSGLNTLRIACVLVLAIACCAGLPLAAQTAHAGGTISIGSGFSIPQGVAVDGSGNVFVADESNGAVKEIVAVGGVVSSSSTVKTVASGFSPYAVAVDGSGNVFVADTGNNAVKAACASGQRTRPAARAVQRKGDRGDWRRGLVQLDREYDWQRLSSPQKTDRQTTGSTASAPPQGTLSSPRLLLRLDERYGSKNEMRSAMTRHEVPLKNTIVDQLRRRISYVRATEVMATSQSNIPKAGWETTTLYRVNLPKMRLRGSGSSKVILRLI